MQVPNLFSLKNKNVLITGATGYLGQAMAWGLAEAGANVLINSRCHERCKVIVNKISDAGLLAENAVFDVTNEYEIKAYFSQRGALALHCLINNAYMGSSGTIETAESISYEKSFNISVISAHKILQSALPSLRLAVKESGGASVINIASMYGSVSPDLGLYKNSSGANPPFYGAAKAGLIQWTKYAACEFGAEGIRVNSISPGPFPAAKLQEESSDFVTKLASKVPLRRVGQPHEIKGVIVLLASSASSYINGANIPIDGGWTSW